MADDEGEEDLYGDLDVDADTLARSEVEEQRDALQSENETLRRRVASLEAENERLERERRNLAKNISCLFKTAKIEIERKDKEIQRLSQGKR